MIDYVVASGSSHNPFLGFVSYCVPTASSAKTPESLFTSLNASGLPDSPDAHEFIAEVFKRVPRKHKRSSADSARKQAEKDAKILRSQKFNFLLDDAAGEDIVPLKNERRKGEEKGKERDKRDRHIRKRDYDEKEWESDEEEKSRKRRRGDEASGSRDDELEDIDMPEDEESRRERERLEDLRDRDAFAERVKDRDRDREKTKKIVEDRSSKNAGAAAEAAQRRQLADDVEARVQALPSLRLHSRQEYLTKRELQQIELLRKEIADDEALFRGMKVSKREQRDLEHKKEVLKLVEERLKINDKWDGYQLPEDYITEQGKIDKRKKEDALYKRYEEAKPKDDQFVTDIDQWEASQTQHSTFRTSAMDKQEIHDDYEYVFDESQTIKFALDVTLESPMTPAEKLLHAQIDAAEKKGALVSFQICFFC
jgi:pre-mRNA-splicing factor ATP-dependent RNA helicase DHX16